MSDAILVLNAGSSSLKLAVYACGHSAPGEALVRGEVEGIGGDARYREAGEAPVAVDDVGLPKPHARGWAHAEVVVAGQPVDLDSPSEHLLQGGEEGLVIGVRLPPGPTRMQHISQEHETVADQRRQKVT